MLNSTNITLGKTSQTIQFNTPCTGILQRSNPKSVFIRFSLGSDMEDKIFPTDGIQSVLIRKDSFHCNETVKVEVLQVLLFGDNKYLVEVVETALLIDED